jgi:xanthine dehydrogenase small subunit
MAAVPTRARDTERRLTGARWSLEAVTAASEALAQDFQPLTDLRASSTYRLEAARNLLRRLYIETTSPAVAVRTADALKAAG